MNEPHAAPARHRAPSGSVSALRAANRERILELLVQHDRLTQAELSRLTGLSAASVSNLVRQLGADGAVAVEPGQQRGRRVSHVSLRERPESVLAVDLGHRTVRMAVVEAGGKTLAELSRRLPHRWHESGDAGFLAPARDALLAEAERADRPPVLAAIGVPAPLDPETGHVSDLAPGWTGADVALRFESALGTPVVLDNDANLGAVGELRLGAGRGCEDFLYLKVSHGIGAGLVVRGRIYHGGLRVAGEIGHTSLHHDGPLCSCGGRGCLELYASGRAIAGALADLHSARPTLQEIVDRTLADDPPFVRAVADAGEQLGLAVANAVGLLAPARIVVGGELAQVGDRLLDPLRHSMLRNSPRTLAGRIDIRSGELGERAGVVGAAELGLSALRAQLGLPGAGTVMTPIRARGSHS